MALAGVLVLLSAVLAVPGNALEAKTKLSLNKKKVTLAVGSTAKLRIKNTKKQVKWTSSRKKVATVSSQGVVCAKKKGTAKITAKVGKRKFVCRVRVVNKNTGSGSSENSNPNSNLNGSENNGSNTGTQQNTPKPSPTANPVQTDNPAEKVLELVNQERAANGLSPLTLDTSLCAAANARAQEITSQFSHTRPDGTNCFTILKDYGISYRAVGENIAAGQTTPAAVMNSWMNSPGHRANILSSSFGKLGVGYVKTSGGYGHYWVQMFTD